MNLFKILSGTLLFLCIMTFLSGCKGQEEPLTEQNFTKDGIAPFVEPDFPFITTSLDATKLGPAFPDDNLAPRVLALRLGEEAYACFDTDMLRWSAAWTGDFLPMVTMAQISYRDFYNKSNKIPTIPGQPQIATGLYPGWSGPDPQFTDPREPGADNDIPWGPIPQELGRWNGIYLVGQEVVMSYTVQGTDIYEHPGVTKVRGETGFTRTIQIDELKEARTMVAAEIANGKRYEVNDNQAFIYQGPNEDTVTAIGIIEPNESIAVNVSGNQYATVKVGSSKESLKFTLVMWKGAVEDKGVFEQMLANTNTEIPDFKNGGPERWSQTIRTRGHLAPDTAAYVVDQLTLPLPNPWNRNVRVVDVAFMEKNRAALVTFEGDVWIVEGIDQELSHLKWHRYASGIYEPQSIEVVQNRIYVYGKEGIIRFHDLNNDGEADYYENFSNLMAQSMETREWATDFVAAPDGSFYVATFGALSAGPKTSASRDSGYDGFSAGSRHDGTVLKIAPDGRSMEQYATGFRGQYLGMNPQTGVLSGSDQQGNYMPSTPIYLIDKGDYYGVPATAYRDPIPEVTPPLTWIPHGVDRSSISQAWITSDQMGPLNGNMVHFSYGRPGLFKVLIDSTRNGVQGGVSLIPGSYAAPTMKGAINPGDGQLYIAGFSLWGSNSPTVSAFQRLRYTGKPGYMPDEFRARDEGVIMRFGIELEKDEATETDNYQVTRWNYQRSEDYGSGHFKLDGSPGEETLPVSSVHLSDDKRAVYLAIPGMEEVMQMQVNYQMKAAGGPVIKDTLYFTVNDLDEINLAAEGFGQVDLKAALAMDEESQQATDDSGKEVSVEQGRHLFQRNGCGACHATREQTEGQGRIGSPLHGLFGSEQNFENGTSTIVDEPYLEEAILEPDKKIVEGYEGEMPSFLGRLSDNEVKSMVMYIKSLRN